MSETQERPTTARLEAFSDGVLAIAITLLVLDLRVPPASDGPLLNQIGKQWPFFAAYAVSFFAIGVMWVNHHALFERIAHIDRGLLYRNLALLGGIAFLPFPTDVLATYVRHGGSNGRVAAGLYGFTMMFIGACFTSLWLHVGRHRDLLERPMTDEALRGVVVRSSVGTAIYLGATLIAGVAPIVALVLFAGVALFFALTRANV
jgi:uncharacterized membrane protein